MARESNAAREREQWRQVLENGDEDRFRQVVEPYMDTMLKAARHDLAYYRAQGYLQEGEITPEEVVGETLIRAWDYRAQRPEKMSLRGWLLGTQYRVLRRMVKAEKDYDEDKVISLDEPVPSEPDSSSDPDVQEQFWEFYQPDEVIIWEDVIPSYEPVDYEVPLFADHDTFELDPDSRHVLMMHDEFEMSLPEVAFTMGNTINETAEKLNRARATLHERMIDQPLHPEVDSSTPPSASRKPDED